MLSQQEIDFIIEHGSDDTSKLLFAAKRYEGIDVSRAVSIIEARKKVKEKIPDWWSVSGLSYPSSLSVEQCSSQATAIYKQQFVGACFNVADLTGGLGVDSYFISQKAATLSYIERNGELFETVKDNFKSLGCNNVEFINSDCKAFLSKSTDAEFDLVYIDPARRDKSANRVYSIEDCEPNIIDLKSSIFAISPRILAKLSPMADISHTLSLLKDCKEIHIVALDNECKEVLAYLERDYSGTTKIVAANIHHHQCDTFSFYPNEESTAKVTLLNGPLQEGYIYQPNKAILKAGAFRLISQRFCLEKLAVSSHLYYSPTHLDEFPGREFKIEKVIPFNKEGISKIRKEYPQADCLAVNFPLDTNSIRKRLQIREGGTIFLIATTLSDGSRVIVISKSN